MLSFLSNIINLIIKELKKRYSITLQKFLKTISNKNII